ncbi:ArsR/SmtB family transcription factor [Halobaculum magnesiiphilum]|uniref:Helix-turn-helix domain-containing protein n=1 Tax=Halobaculum magnesiiphilum TaxID=1017351 RepID=A0A8T8WDZ2_9EURY|nr:winged helix-turn-helix domain-containing protein [Halobaculum magnesiiphilum]QZP38082.1 helix-turn-helix domain-containing protein [Halobaculum magnesiiphilum]
MNDGHDASPGHGADAGVAANDADAADADATDAAGASPDEVDDAGASAVAPDDAFAALADETRLRTVRALASADRPLGFTELFERVADDPDGPSAGFAYHLRQLTDRYVRTDDDGRYRPTFAGRQAARALDAGVYTERVDRDPEPVDGDCPVCGAAALEARIADNHVGVACTDCATELLALPFPPGGVRDRDTDEVLPAFDAYHRARLRQLADGVCPDCAGRAEGKITFVEPAELPDAAEAGERDADAADAPARPVVAGACADCDFRVRVPVSVALAEHPAVVAFCDDHGIDVRERPIWNLGSEWAEGVLSTDPPAVRVSVAGDGETLRLLVGDGPTVVETDRVTAAEDDRSGTGPTERSTEGGPEGDDADDQAATAAGSS